MRDRGIRRRFDGDKTQKTGEMDADSVVCRIVFCVAGRNQSSPQRRGAGINTSCSAEYNCPLVVCGALDKKRRGEDYSGED